MASYKMVIEPHEDFTLSMLMHSHKEYRFFWEYHFVKRQDDKRFGEPIFSNKLQIMADYEKGKISNLELRMDLTNIKKRGVKYAWGLDISPDSKLFLEFRYKKHPKGWRLDEILKSCQSIWKYTLPQDKMGTEVVELIDFPFPVPDLLETKGGLYMPYTRMDEDAGSQQAEIAIPTNLKM